MKKTIINTIIITCSLGLTGCCGKVYKRKVEQVYAETKVAVERCDMKEGDDKAACFEETAKLNEAQMECLYALTKNKKCGEEPAEETPAPNPEAAETEGE